MPFDSSPVAASAPPTLPPTVPASAVPPASEPLPLPPDITVTREDVRALPLRTTISPPSPPIGRMWCVVSIPGGWRRWGEVPIGTPVEDRVTPAGGATQIAPVTALEAETAERAFLWQTALASDAALADIGADPHVPRAAPRQRN